MAATREKKVPALVDKPMDFCPGCGHGIVSRLIMEALESTREAGYSVIPTCSAVEGFIEKNPDFQDMVHQG